MRPNQAYLNLKSAAEYLGISYRTAKEDWPSWEKAGVVPSRYRNRRMLLFKKTDLDRMVESWKVMFK